MSECPASERSPPPQSAMAFFVYKESLLFTEAGFTYVKQVRGAAAPLRADLFCLTLIFSAHLQSE